MGLANARLPEVAKYTVIEELGHGGMATVFRAHDKRLGRDVALKILHAHLRDSVEIGHRFAAEARAVAKLRHPNIVEVYDVSDDGESERFLVVELVEGATLRAILKERGHLPPEVAGAIGIELLNALAHAHEQGVIHRDIKPENVMVRCTKKGKHGQPPSSRAASAESERERTSGPLPGDRVAIKLMDFGIAKLLDAQGVTSTGQVLGSPAHMAPEQIEGADVDARADVFGIGVLLYECMVGHLPFEGTNPAQVLRRVLEGTYAPAEHERPLIGKSWSALLDHALEKEPENRFASAAAMRDELKQELVRLGYNDPRSLIEDYFDDDEFEERHRVHIVQTLSDLGMKARHRGDVLAAAADLNRALAYAPEDAALMKAVLGMRKADERRSFLRRKVFPTMLVLLAGFVAFFVTKAIRHRYPTIVAPVVAPTAEALVLPPPTASSPPTSAPTATAKPPPTASARASAAPRNTRRQVRLGSVRPQEGVVVSIDGAPSIAAFAGATFTVDDKEHEFRFGCKADLCEPTTRMVPPGERDVELSIELSLKRAILLVEGDPQREYGIKEYPNVRVRSGLPAPLALSRNGDPVTVMEFGTSRQKTVILRAGQTVKAVFDAVP
ncbi:MAG: serine/threonine-protein kinase [Polyangiaceae bacterium]